MSEFSHRRLVADRSRLGIDKAEEARRQMDWASAISVYKTYLAVRPKDLGVHLRLIRTYQAAGYIGLAEAAIRTQLRQRPDRADLQDMLAETLVTMGRFDEAFSIAASGHSLKLNSNTNSLVDDWEARLKDSLRVARLRARIDEAVDTPRASDRTVTPLLADYNVFRQSTRPPQPPHSDPISVTVLVDARNGGFVELRATLLSLLSQIYPAWTVRVLAPEEMLDHSVASLSYVDGRIEIISIGDDQDTAVSGPILRLDAGCVLDPDAIGWMVSALSNTDAVAVYSDHDRGWDHWTHGAFRFDPALQCRPQLDDLRTNPRPPIATLFRSQEIYSATTASGQGLSDGMVARLRLMAALEHGEVVHIPLVLATRLEIGVLNAATYVPAREGPDWIAQSTSPHSGLERDRILPSRANESQGPTNHEEIKRDWN